MIVWYQTYIEEFVNMVGIILLYDFNHTEGFS